MALKRVVFNHKHFIHLKSVAHSRGLPRHPISDHNFLNFMQFLGKSGEFVCWCPSPKDWRPLLQGILDPPLVVHLSWLHDNVKKAQLASIKWLTFGVVYGMLKI